MYSLYQSKTTFQNCLSNTVSQKLTKPIGPGVISASCIIEFPRQITLLDLQYL